MGRVGPQLVVVTVTAGGMWHCNYPTIRVRSIWNFILPIIRLGGNGHYTCPTKLIWKELRAIAGPIGGGEEAAVARGEALVQKPLQVEAFNHLWIPAQ